MNAKRSPSKANGSDAFVHVRINTELEQYEGFFDPKWAKAIDHKTREYPDIYQLVGELLFSIKATSNAFRFPWLTAKLHHSFATAYSHANDHKMAEYLKQMRQRLRAAAPNNDEVSKAFDDIADEVTRNLLLLQSNRQELIATASEDIAKTTFSEYICTF